MTTALAVSILSSSVDVSVHGSSDVQDPHIRSYLTGTTSVADATNPVQSSNTTAATSSPTSQAGQSSSAFICTVISAMMGSTLMCLPWAFENAGILASLVMIIVVGIVSYYTSYVILHWGMSCGSFADFSDVCNYYLGPWAKHVANATSVSVCVGVLATYHVLMASSLQAVVINIGAAMKYDVTFFCCGEDNFEYLVSAVVVSACVFPMLCFKSIGLLLTIGSYGGVAVAYNVLFIVGNAIVDWPGKVLQTGRELKLAGTMKDCGVFFGTLGLSLFIHNLLLQMGQGHRWASAKPVVVKRDVGVAYFFAVMFYIVVGAIPAVAFELGGNQYKYLNGGQLPQNILLTYSHAQWGAIVGQLLLTLQISIIYPLIATVIRRQFFASITGSDWPGWPQAVTFSLCLCAFTTLVAAMYPYPGKLVGYVGVYTAIVYMLGLPILVHLRALKTTNTASKFSTVIHVIIFVIMTLAFLLQFIF